MSQAVILIKLARYMSLNIKSSNIIIKQVFLLNILNFMVFHFSLYELFLAILPSRAIFFTQIVHSSLFDAHQTEHITFVVGTFAYLLPSPSVLSNHPYQYLWTHECDKLLNFSEIRVQRVWY